MGIRPKGPQVGWIPASEFQQAVLADILARMQQHRDEDTLPRSPRGLFYDLRPHGMGNGVTYVKQPQMFVPPGSAKNRKVNPMEASPADVQEVLVMARRAHLVEEHEIEDSRAPDPLIPPFDPDTTTAETMADRLVRVIRNPRIAYSPQSGQEVFLEVLVEAAGLMGRVERIAGDRGVPVYSGGGFAGLKAKREMAERASVRPVPTIVLQISDYDPHGFRITTSHELDSIAWSENEYDCEPDWLTFERIALTESQAADHDLLDDDGKAEAEGLPVQVMDGILTDAIGRYQDPDIAEANRERGNAERVRVEGLVRDILAESA